MTTYSNADALADYCEDRAIALPGTVDGGAALLVASEYIDLMFGAAFSGEKTLGRDQEREWPRTGAFDVDGYQFAVDAIPRELIAAVHELAVIEANAPGGLTVNFTPSKYESASVDGAVSVKWSGVSSAAEAQPEFFKVKRLLAPLLTGVENETSSISGKAVRA